MKLSGIKQAHKKGFHGVVMVMGIGYLIAAVLLGKTIYRPPAKKGTGVAGLFSLLGFDGSGNIHIYCFIGNFQLLQKILYFGSFFCKIRRKHGINGKGSQGKAFI